MLKTPLKKRLIGQHAYASSAVALVSFGDGHWVEIGAQQAGRGGCLLDLGDDLDFTRLLQGRLKIAHRGSASQLGFQLTDRNAMPCFLDLPLLAHYDLVENRCHRFVSLFGESTRRRRPPVGYFSAIRQGTAGNYPFLGYRSAHSSRILTGVFGLADRGDRLR